MVQPVHQLQVFARGYARDLVFAIQPEPLVEALPALGRVTALADTYGVVRDVGTAPGQGFLNFSQILIFVDSFSTPTYKFHLDIKVITTLKAMRGIVVIYYSFTYFPLFLAYRAFICSDYF